MKSLYLNPLRVYLCLGCLALYGLWTSLQLPVSLFPHSSKPTIEVEIPYGQSTASEFKRRHGLHLESQLRAIATDTFSVEKTKTHYHMNRMRIDLEFHWGTPARAALREVETLVHTYASQFSEEIRHAIRIEPKQEHSGFLIASFYSMKRNLNEVYTLLEPTLIPEITQLPDIAPPHFWNPEEKEVRIELNPEKMAAFQLFPKDIEKSIRSALIAYNGGVLGSGSERLSLQLPRSLRNLEDLKKLTISTPSQQTILLTDIADISENAKTLNPWLFKTNGSPSLVLFAKPKLGGNIKRMSEEIVQTIESTLLRLPQDLEYKVLINPAHFIKKAIHHIGYEVFVGSLLAVLVLFLFIGNFKNTITAAIEIPLSLVLAFIPMQASGMSLNLISLGGLALSAGMNVDASIVVMENIFRHFNHLQTPISPTLKIRTVLKAVNEVKASILSSTLASIVVFLPILWLSGLNYALLGDLAKAVIFSHAFSAIIALILVPTVRLQLLDQPEPHRPALLEKKLLKLEQLYVACLKSFLNQKKLQKFSFFFIPFLLISLMFFVIPRLPKEVMSKPDTDDLILYVATQGNTVVKQMEELLDDVEQQLLKNFEKEINYTLMNIHHPNHGWLMVHLKNRSHMISLQRRMEVFFKNTPLRKYMIMPYNPAELPLPDPPHLRIAVRGGTHSERLEMTRDLFQLLDENQVFPRLWTEPHLTKNKGILLKAQSLLWPHLKKQGFLFEPADLADLVRTTTSGRKIGELFNHHIPKDIILRSKQSSETSIENLQAIPIGIGPHLVPLKALMRFEPIDTTPTSYQENQRDLFLISGKMNEGDSALMKQQRLQQAQTLVQGFLKQNPFQSKSTPLHVFFEDAGHEIHSAIHQLIVAILSSIGLIFFILLIQFKDPIHALLVLLAIPFGVIGVLLSLFLFKSTLSLNALLGIILLNGIAVANSILLVDFMMQLIHQGRNPTEAALEAAQKRLRPILMTSLTTILGMFPIALGLGTGGKILQPLGIAVSGGLWVSMSLTLLFVPTLHVRYLNWKQNPR